MTDIMKLATDYAQACYHLANPESYDAERAEEARAALQEAIEALQAENERLNDDCAMHMRVAVKAIDEVVELKAERDTLRAQLEAMQRQESVIDFTVLHQFASDQAISYNKLCTAVRMCFAAPKALEPLTDKEVSRLWSIAHDDTTDRMAFQVLVRLVEKHHGITKGTPT